MEHADGAVISSATEWTVGEVSAPMTIRFGAGKQHRSASPCSSFFFLSTLLVSTPPMPHFHREIDGAGEAQNTGGEGR